MIDRLPEKAPSTPREVAQAMDKHLSTKFRSTLVAIRGRKLPSVQVDGQRYVDLNNLLFSPDDTCGHAVVTSTTSCKSRMRDVDAELNQAGF